MMNSRGGVSFLNWMNRGAGEIVRAPIGNSAEPSGTFLFVRYSTVPAAGGPGNVWPAVAWTNASEIHCIWCCSLPAEGMFTYAVRWASTSCAAPLVDAMRCVTSCRRPPFADWTVIESRTPVSTNTPQSVLLVGGNGVAFVQRRAGSTSVTLGSAPSVNVTEAGSRPELPARLVLVVPEGNSTFRPSTCRFPRGAPYLPLSLMLMPAPYQR